MKQNYFKPERISTQRWVKRSSLFGIVALAALVLSLTAIPRQDLAAQNKWTDYEGRYVYADLAEAVLPSVVTIYVEKDLKNELNEAQQERLRQFREFFEDNPQFRGFDMFPWLEEEDPNVIPEGPDGFVRTASGSGVVVHEDGYILTNHHVLTRGLESIETAIDPETTRITVVLSDGTEIDGEDVELVASHSLSDLALLKVNHKELRPLEWGDSSELRIGERVAALGSPLDLRATITQGIVCAVGRSSMGFGLGDLIQTDAVINPGSSGGALVNLDGKLVGINRLITTNTGRWQGYGFAIPSNDARHFAEQVIEKGRVAYGYIGITMAGSRENTPRMREALGLDRNQEGVLVLDVTQNAPAEEAGLQQGDYIVAIDGNEIEDNTDLLNYIARQPVGSEVTMKVLRPTDNYKVEELELDVAISERPEEEVLLAQARNGELELEPDGETEPKPSTLLGMTLDAYATDDYAGLRIESIEQGSPAARAGLRKGDVIIEFNMHTVTKFAEAEEALEAKPEGRPHLVKFIREGRRMLAAIGESN